MARRRGSVMGKGRGGGGLLLGVLVGMKPEEVKGAEVGGVGGPSSKGCSARAVRCRSVCSAETWTTSGKAYLSGTEPLRYEVYSLVTKGSVVSGGPWS